MNTILQEKLKQEIYKIPDPEVPVLTIEDLGIVRNIEFGEELIVTITPTYSGCPAMKYIEDNIKQVAKVNGIDSVKVNTVFNPAWTTDWLSENGKKKLLAYGIAPPNKTSVNKGVLFGKDESIVACPQCKSKDTIMISQFGSTACKALYKCNTCLETFDYFKCI